MCDKKQKDPQSEVKEVLQTLDIISRDATLTQTQIDSNDAITVQSG